jgi:hypothetical protein
MRDLSYTDLAYNVISKRTGVMKNGQFVKDSTEHPGFNNENTSNT